MRPPPSWGGNSRPSKVLLLLSARARHDHLLRLEKSQPRSPTATHGSLRSPPEVRLSPHLDEEGQWHSAG